MHRAPRACHRAGGRNQHGGQCNRVHMAVPLCARRANTKRGVKIRKYVEVASERSTLFYGEREASTKVSVLVDTLPVVKPL